jgi:hypothetical protein
MAIPVDAMATSPIRSHEDGSAGHISTEPRVARQGSFQN